MLVDFVVIFVVVGFVVVCSCWLSLLIVVVFVGVAVVFEIVL